MTCEPYREAASARLDGEVSGMPDEVLDAHLARCPHCTSWLAAAAQAGRMLRISGHTPPDLSEPILRHVRLPAARLFRHRRLLQVGLGLLAVLQWVVAVPGLRGQDLGMGAAMAVGAHPAHESAAWNVAVGVALLAVALRPSWAAGTLPILATFVAVLSVLSVLDLRSGAVTGGRLSSHAGVVLAVLLIAVLARSERLPRPRPARLLGAGRTVGRPDGHSPAGPMPRRHRGAA